MVAKSDCNVWVMTAATFRRLVREASAEEQAAKLLLLKGVPTLTDLANSGAGVDADRASPAAAPPLPRAASSAWSSLTGAGASPSPSLTHSPPQLRSCWLPWPPS